MGLNKLNHIYTTEPLTVESLLATNDIGILDNILLDGQLGDANQVIAINSQGNGIEWATLDALPSQSGNSGKYLTTNGTVASWANIDLPTVVFNAIGTGSAQNIDTAIDETLNVGAEYAVAISTATGRYVSKVLLICDGTNPIKITEYGILTIGTAPSVTVAAGGSASAPRLSVNAPLNATITLVRTLLEI